MALPTEYPDGYHVPQHRHSRSQLLHALVGVVLVTTRHGRWMVPPDHAMWIPAGIEHSVEMLGDVSMRSVYVMPDAIPGLPEGLRVVGITDLMHSLIVESEKLPQGARTGRARRVDHGPFAARDPQPAGTAARAAVPFRSEAGSTVPALRRGTLATRDDRRMGRHRRHEPALVYPRLPSPDRAVAVDMAPAGLPVRGAARLADGEPITRVALDLGYDSVPAFITMFKRMLGASPRGYMRGARDAGEGMRRAPPRLDGPAP